MLREQLIVRKQASTHSQPKVAVVVPIFKQGALLPDALESVMAQEAPFEITTILVNDGCPFPETHAICRDWAVAHGDRVVYLRKANGGLSSARNAGIEFVVRHLPSVRAIYFLDADNRLLSTSLARAFAELRKYPYASWIYPNIDMFGLQAAYGYEGEYSLLHHLNENICEAGSLVHRRVFDAGVRFDESMKSGYEDWDFWLSAATKGFRGRCLPEFGFEYRRRPESMVSGSHREHEAIRSYMRAKHKALFRPSNLLREEHSRSPRYAVFLQDRRRFVLFTDPASESEERELADMERLLWMGINEPARANPPAFLVATTSGFLSLMRRARLAPWVFWHLEDRLGEPHVAALECTVSAQDNKIKFHDHGIDATAGKGKHVPMAMMGWHLVEACAKDSTTRWFDSITTAEPSPRVSVTELALPQRLHAARGERESAIESLQGAVHRLHDSRYRDGAVSQWTWRNVSDARRQPTSLIVRRLSELDCPLFPVVAAGDKRGPHVALVVPLVSLGGVEKVAVAVAGELKKRGFVPHLVVSDFADANLPSSALAVFDSVSFLNEAPQMSPGARYFGTMVPAWSAAARDRSLQRAIGLLAGFDVVINSHSVNLNAIMGDLRRRGVKTIAHQHVVDHTPAGAPCGHPYLAVAYEHAYDALIAESRSIRDWLHGMGVPYDKLILVENAPSFAISAAECEAALRERTTRNVEAPLRVAFVGRFDRQKGLHRIEALYEKISSTGVPVDWRIVGAPVIREEAAGWKLPKEILYPPTSTPDGLTEHLKWADVLLLLSSWEGMPLILLDAMALGVIPLCTDVGAIREAVEDGVSGFVVAKETAVGDAFQALSRLQKESGLKTAMATRASLAGRTRQWSHSVEPLVTYLKNSGVRAAS